MAFLRCYGSPLSLTSTYTLGYEGGTPPLVLYSDATVDQGLMVVDYSGIPVGSTIISATMYRTAPNITNAQVYTIDAPSRVTFVDALPVQRITTGGSTPYLVRFKAKIIYSGSPGTRNVVLAFTNVYVDVEYRPPSSSIIQSPTYASVAPAITVESTGTLSYSGAHGSSSNILSDIQYRYSDSEDLETWGEWSDPISSGKISSSGSFSVPTSSILGIYRRYEVRSVGSQSNGDWYLATGTIQQMIPTKATSPTTASISPSVAENKPTLSYSGAAGGQRNDILAIQYQYSDSTNSTTWGDWSSTANSNQSGNTGSFLVPLPSTRLHYRRFRIRAMGAAGETYAGDWFTNNSLIVQKSQYTSMTGPASIVPELSATSRPTIYLAGNRPINGIGNTLERMLVEYRDSTDRGATWPEEWVYVGSAKKIGDFDDSFGYWVHSWQDKPYQVGGFHIRNIPMPTVKGHLRQYRVKLRGTAGAQYDGPWVETTQFVERLTPPSPPITSSPVYWEDRAITTYAPRILLELYQEGDFTPSQKLTIKSGTYKNSSRELGVYYPVGTRIRLSRSSTTLPYPAPAQMDLALKDSTGAEIVSGLQWYIYATQDLSFSDAPYTKYTTKVKAKHIREIRDAVNRAETYYRLTPTEWRRSIVSGTTDLYEWKEDVEEIRESIEAIAAHINLWDTSSTVGAVTLPEWISLTRKPSAAVMNQLRECLLLF